MLIIIDLKDLTEEQYDIAQKLTNKKLQGAEFTLLIYNHQEPKLSEKKPTRIR